ncbi:MAG: trypsin-like peptidase domain-containing protein [Spirochaetales bacterium]|jgi:S1-C subfamily serine protease|nr:trypsin-like peptidase domain-containing protein [Spirochaetales bacterium]
MSTKVLSAMLIAVMLSASVVQSKIASEVFKEVSPSVVVIRTYDTQGNDKMLGSGVTLKDGVVVTNCHVLKDAATIQVDRHDIKYPATLLQSDWDRDICSLSVNGLKGQAVTKGSTTHLQVGDKVYVVGAPQGLDLTLSDGLISSLHPVAGGQYLQITAPISPGSSGGGLFDAEGRLIGLPTFYLAGGQQLNFAVPVEWVNELPKRNAPAPKAKKTTSTEWLNQTIEFEEVKDWPGMLKHTYRWVKNQPREGAWLNLGRAYEKNNQLNKSIEAFQQALRINPENAGV